jgi:hypothetical protein
MLLFEIAYNIPNRIFRKNPADCYEILIFFTFFVIPFIH